MKTHLCPSCLLVVYSQDDTLCLWQWFGGNFLCIETNSSKSMLFSHIWYIICVWLINLSFIILCCKQIGFQLVVSYSVCINEALIPDRLCEKKQPLLAHIKYMKANMYKHKHNVSVLQKTDSRCFHTEHDYCQGCFVYVKIISQWLKTGHWSVLQMPTNIALYFVLIQHIASYFVHQVPHIFHTWSGRAVHHIQHLLG